MFSTSDKDTRRWLDDLVTTKARQGTGELGNSKTGFCCLGRACVVFDPKRKTSWQTADSEQPSTILPELHKPIEDAEVLDLFGLLPSMSGKQYNPPFYMLFAKANDELVLLSEDAYPEDVTRENKLNFKDIALFAGFVEAVLNDPPSPESRHSDG